MTYELDVVCTGKGTHKRARLTKIAIDEDGGGSWRAGSGFYPATSDAWETISPRLDGKSNEVFVADCGRCPRNFELTPENFRYLVVALRERGVSRLDISRLPF
jgi:hypothetical protein